MTNNPKDILEVLDVLDNVTFEQLDEAIKKADKFFARIENANQEETYSIKNNFNFINDDFYIEINSQQFEVSNVLNNVSRNNNLVSEEGENEWKKETVLAA